MELWDVLDINGNPTGKVIEKDGDLGPGEYYMGVHMYIKNSEGKFLVQKRAKCKKYYADIWDINMGHAITGETSKEAAIREIAEEIGIKLKDNEVHFVKRFIWEQYNHMLDIWVIHKDIDMSETTLQEDEVSELKNLTKDELIALLEDQSPNRPWRPAEYVEIIKSL